VEPREREDNNKHLAFFKVYDKARAEHTSGHTVEKDVIDKLRFSRSTIRRKNSSKSWNNSRQNERTEDKTNYYIEPVDIEIISQESGNNKNYSKKSLYRTF
jgi:hypothetical protein